MPHNISLIRANAARMKLPALVGEAEAKLLESENAGKIFLGEEELALSMMRYVLERSALAQRHT